VYRFFVTLQREQRLFAPIHGEHCVAGPFKQACDQPTCAVVIFHEEDDLSAGHRLQGR
jgi:hypothetical protein